MVSFVGRVFLVRWSRYNPYYLEPEVSKEAYSTPETELSAEEKEQRELKAVRPFKAATSGVTSSVFSDPVLRYWKNMSCAPFRNSSQAIMFVFAFQ